MRPVVPILNLGHAIAEQGFRNSGALISELITENRRLQLGYARVNVLGGPVVYVWSRRQVGVLYVGSSANGGARFLSAHHHALRLEPNDVLSAVNGTPLFSGADFTRELFLHRAPGEEGELTFLRSGAGGRLREIKVWVILGDGSDFRRGY